MDTATETRPVPAGWYPDPETPDRTRWWDGTQWAAAGAPSDIGVVAAPVAAANRAGALLVVAVTVVVAVIAGPWTLWHHPTVRLDSADAVKALPSDDQITEVYGAGMTATRKVTATTATTTGAAEAGASSCGMTSPPTVGEHGGAELGANGTNPKRRYEVTSYVFDSEAHAEAATTGMAVNLRGLAGCMSSRWPAWQITATDTADGVEICGHDSGSASVLVVTPGRQRRSLHRRQRHRRQPMRPRGRYGPHRRSRPARPVEATHEDRRGVWHGRHREDAQRLSNESQIVKATDCRCQNSGCASTRVE